MVNSLDGFIFNGLRPRSTALPFFRFVGDRRLVKSHLGSTKLPVRVGVKTGIQKEIFHVKQKTTTKSNYYTN